MVKRLGSFVNKDREIIHSPFHGEILQGRETISAKIRVNNISSMEWKSITLHTYSPFGIEFVNTPDLNLKQGDKISLRISLASDETLFDGLVVNGAYNIGGTNIAGVRTFVREKKGDIYSGAERRAHRRWSCSDDFLPTGLAPNPIRYNDYILFRVEDISVGGLKIITSMRNKFIGIGQELECNLSLPYVGTTRADVTIQRINTTFYKEKEFMVVGVEFIKPDSKLLKTLGEYLLNFAKDATIKSLNSDGFCIKNVSKWLDFSYVKTEEEYKEVLELRYKTYKAAGKLKDNATVEDVADEFDSKASIIIAKYQGRIIGSMRCVLPTKFEEMETSTEKIENQTLLRHPVEKIIEISRLCISEEYRKNDIKSEIFAHAALTTIKNKRRYIYTAFEPSAIGAFEKIGFKKTGVKFLEDKLNDWPHEFAIQDIYGVALGKNINIKNWFKTYRNLSSYLIKNNILKPTAFNTLKLYIYEKLGALFLG